MALIDLNQTAFHTTGDTDPLLHVCSVEIRTSTAASYRSAAVSNASVDLVCAEMGTPAFLKRIPCAPVGQILQLLIALRVSYLLYVACSEAALISYTLIKASPDVLQEARRVLDLNGNSLLNWGFDSPDQFPPFVAPDTKSAEVQAPTVEGHEFQRTK